MNEMSNYEVKHLEHLGLIAGFCEEIGLVEYINQRFPLQPAEKELSYGQCLLAMILNGLGYTSQTLYLQSEYFSDKPIEKLLGKGITPEHINDYVLGRSLDKFFEYGVSELYMGLADKVVSHLDLKMTSQHLDSTSFHVDGNYEGYEDEDCIQLVKGYSRDHRPGLNQAVLNLIVENQASIPLYMKAASGNTVDKSGFQDIIQAHLKSLKGAQDNPYFIMDSAGYCKDNLIHFDEQQRYLISRVPAQLKEAKLLIQETETSHMSALEKGYKGVWYESNYGGVAQKWLLIHSQQAFEREAITLDKNILKQSEQGRKSFKKLKAQAFSCEADARKQCQKWQETQKYLQLSNVSIRSQGHYDKKGKPAKDKTFDYYLYYIEGDLYTSLAHREQVLKTKGMFIIATNDVRGKLSMQALLNLYKAQQTVERGFRFMKNPEFLTSSFYLKKPQRIEALLMVMTCCLMVYAGIEHKIRTGLKEKSLSFPNQKNKLIQNPTARWVFYCFHGIDILTIDQNQSIVVNLQERHHTILQTLGKPYDFYYS